METETRTPDTDDVKCTECCDWVGDYACPNDESMCLFCCPCHVEDLEPIVPTNAARAVGRFDPAGVHGYRSSHSPSAPLRATREEAEQDWLAGWHALPTRNVAGDPLIGCRECGGLIYDSHHDGLCGSCRPVDPCCTD